jgi:hypothetical protein
MDTLDPFRRYFRIAALVCSAASAVLTFSFGMHQNPNAVLALALAAFLVACSLASDYIILFVTESWKRGSRIAVAGMVAAGAFVFSLNLMSNIGSVGWQKDATVTEAKMQTTNYTDIGVTIAKAEDNERIYANRIKQLSEANGGWVTSVTADALRARIPGLELAIERESKRGGCGPKCQDRTNERDEVASRIGVIEEINKSEAMLTATRQALAKLRNERSQQKPAVAAADSQSQFFASLIRFDLKPSDDAKAWTSVGMSSWLAIGLCIAPILFGFIGWRTEPDAPETVASKPANDVSRATHSQPKEDIWAVIDNALNRPRIAA